MGIFSTPTREATFIDKMHRDVQLSERIPDQREATLTDRFLDRDVPVNSNPSFSERVSNGGFGSVDRSDMRGWR